ncbi:MAG TPA: glutamate--tRNA ligase [Gemmatimonadales bacterium]|nr:glutamate--tRNA ligase [Gemmatimonadales bacterium]
MSSPRVRFAPSPTGYLHVGGARTALFNWLFARKTGGTFILRIEDTDRERSTDEHTRVILDGLTWLGITWDEGPYFQGEYAARHRADAERLLADGQAYRCFCTRDELEAARVAAERAGQSFRYDGRCDRLSPAEVEDRLARGVPFAIRLRMPDQELAWDDAVHGRISFQGRDLDDFIVLRSDGTPVYNLAVVSDDLAMRITHVIRGDDHISNTPKQIAIYRALGRPLPVFAHVPMILGPDGKKLSKRHGATAVGDYQKQGILPLAMRNFLALLGWSPGGDREILSESEMIQLFSLEGIQKKPAVFDVTKLEWMNGQYLSMLPPAELRAPVLRHLAEMGLTVNGVDLDPVIDAVKARSRTLLDVARQVAVRLRGAPGDPDPKATQFVTKLGPERYRENLERAARRLETLEDWTPASIAAALAAEAERSGQKLGDVMQPIRIALTGGTVSEPVDQLVSVIARAAGREAVLARLRNAAR